MSINLFYPTATVMVGLNYVDFATLNNTFKINWLRNYLEKTIQYLEHYTRIRLFTVGRFEFSIVM